MQFTRRPMLMFCLKDWR